MSQYKNLKPNEKVFVWELRDGEYIFKTCTVLKRLEPDSISNENYELRCDADGEVFKQMARFLFRTIEEAREALREKLIWCIDHEKHGIQYGLDIAQQHREEAEWYEQKLEELDAEIAFSKSRWDWE